MGENKKNLASIYSITTEATNLVSGAVVPIKISGNLSLTGFLLYAVGDDPAARVGSFSLIDGTKAAEGCGEFTLDTDKSVVTHSAPGVFTDPTFMFTVPEKATSISFNAIVVKKIETGGFAWGILADALTLVADVDDDAATPGATSCEATETATTTECDAAETVVVTKTVFATECQAADTGVATEYAMVKKEKKCRRKGKKEGRKGKKWRSERKSVPTQAFVY